MERVNKDAFCVIGKVGSTKDGEGFVQKLWKDANSHFEEVSDLAAKDEDGTFLGFWGAMTNFAFEFLPWENNYSEGLYLAGVEADVNAVAPRGWKKWILPGFEYLKVPAQENTFANTIQYMRENAIPLVGAVQDFTDPKTGQSYMLFPVAVNNSKKKLIQRIKAQTDPFSFCGLHCDYCFLSEWCGGCKSACNMCSYATESDDNICPNAACCKGKGYDSCYECKELEQCNKGFYNSDCDGANASKALAIFRREHGDNAVVTALKKLHDRYDFVKLQEVLDGNLTKAVEQLMDAFAGL